MGTVKKRTLVPRFESGPLAGYCVGTVPTRKLTRVVETVAFDGLCWSEPTHWSVWFRAYVNGEAYPSIHCRVSEEILDECLDSDCDVHADDFKRMFQKHRERLYDKAEELLIKGGRVEVDRENPHNTRLLLVFRRADFTA